MEKTPAKVPDSSSKKDTSSPVVNEKEKKKQAFLVRAFWTLVMIAGMFFIIGAGHIWTILLVVLLQILVFKECITITTEKARIENLPFTASLNWYFLITSIYFLDGESLIYHSINKLQTEDYERVFEFFKFFIVNHRFISYCLYVLGFVFFVASLTKGYYKFQFAQLCITTMTLLLVVVQAHCIVNNILNGLIWFLLPVGLVIVNDIFAYLCGITFGRTQLIEISPKKTVEGFVGAWICTGGFSMILSYVFSKYTYLICPVEDNLSANWFTGMTCDPNPIFIPQIFKVPEVLVDLAARVDYQVDFVSFKPIYFHSMVLATFASLIAPFGGFFASGLKRAFKVKDFGDTIPGHGGITDRMDCQFLMGSFSYLYYETFISNNKVNIGTILQSIVINLSEDQIVTLVQSLHKYLFKIGVINEDTYKQLVNLI
ncbi:BA75_01909T0 [Komagataella pastoris]|uniref:Phosphatidate cytidylyltransferase n=1 Tax=Komagataella pastoris TaxID=4922 RepID=A0A1B2JA83_PICPA|nr:BA75_01909T0 [Komagataella pastoris]